MHDDEWPFPIHYGKRVNALEMSMTGLARPDTSCLRPEPDLLFDCLLTI